MEKSVWLGTQKCLSYAAEKNDTCLLFFSATGKDSIVLLHLINKLFKRVICVYMYLVDDLDLINNYLQWAKSFPNVEIVKFPHLMYYQYKTKGIYCTKAIKGFKKLEIKDIENFCKMQYATDISFWGVKVSDSYNRRGMFHEASKDEYHRQYNRTYPLINWKNKDCYNYINLHKLPQPLKLGSKSAGSGVSFKKETIEYIKKHYPNDYKKMCNEFDLLEIKYGKI